MLRHGRSLWTWKMIITCLSYEDELAAVRQAESFLRLNVNVFTDMDNRERGRSRDKNKGDVFCWKKNMKSFVTDVRK